jgi:hypothetical protein
MGSAERHELLSDTHRGNGARDPEHIRALQEGAAEMRRSPKRSVARLEAQMCSYGSKPTEEQRAKVEGAAISRATRASDRSLSTRALEAKVAEAWPTGATQMEIANDLHVTQGRVAQIARELGLPSRRRAGRPRNY